MVKIFLHPDKEEVTCHKQQPWEAEQGLLLCLRKPLVVVGSLKQAGQTSEVPCVLIVELYWQGQNGKFGIISAAVKKAVQFRSPCKLGGIWS